ncbi:MAG: integrase core domain-containing protein [Candidatus Bipolaricaulis sp.]|nr:integrase core domain-containing protein [Candidatus Bipolaricaulis sp.]
MLTVLDEYTRESLAIRVERSIRAERVIETLEWLFLTRGSPQYLRSDNGPELVAKAVQNLLAHNGCRTIYIEPGSPWENPYIESFHGTFRRECLDRYAFASGLEAQGIVAAWRQEYNEARPHSSLGYLTPAEFSHRCRMKPDQATSSPVVDRSVALTAGST